MFNQQQEIPNQDNEIERCYNCNCIPDDILMLACDHDLCLNCSAIQYNATKIHQVIKCADCNQQTSLDEETCFELEKILAKSYQKQNFQKLNLKNLENNKQINTTFTNFTNKMTPAQKLGFQQPKSQYSQEKTHQNSFYSQMQQQQQFQEEQQQYQQHQQSVFSNNQNYSIHQTSTSRNNINLNIKQFCRQHPEEEVMYFCFDCETECMCAECVIHGPHKDHEVKTLKKSFPLIKETLQKFIASINQQTIKINGQKDQFLDCKKQLRENNKYMQESISKNFQELHLKIQLKEKELLQNCQNMYEQNLDQIDTFTNQLNTQIDYFQNQYEFLTNHLKVQNDWELLNFYSENLPELKQIGEMKETYNIQNQESIDNQIKLEYDFDDIQKEFIKISQQVLDFKPQVLKKQMQINLTENSFKNNAKLQQEKFKQKIMKELAEKENILNQSNKNQNKVDLSLKQSFQKLNLQDQKQQQQQQQIDNNNNYKQNYNFKNNNIIDDIDMENDASEFRKSSNNFQRKSSRVLQQINSDSINNQSQIPYQQDNYSCITQQEIIQSQNNAQRIPTYSDI